MSTVNGLPVRRRDPEPGEPGVEIGEQDHPAEPVAALLDDPPGLGPLGLERGVALRRGAERAVGIPRQRDPERAAGDPHVVEVDQRRRAARPAPS